MYIPSENTAACPGPIYRPSFFKNKEPPPSVIGTPSLSRYGPVHKDLSLDHLKIFGSAGVAVLCNPSWDVFRQYWVKKAKLLQNYKNQTG